MPKTRTYTFPQHNADQAHYGAISIEMFPDGTAVGQIPYWDGVQWRLVTLLGEAGIDIALDTVNDTLTFIHVDNRVYEMFTGDAVLFKTTSGSLTGNAVLLKTIAASFTADAILLDTEAATFTGDAELV